MPAKINSTSDPNLVGTTKCPIQLVQSGNDFITLQHLQSHQVTQIAKKIRESRGIQDPSIIYEDKSNNRKLFYKIITKAREQFSLVSGLCHPGIYFWL